MNSTFPTTNPERAKAWVRAINKLVYNQSSYPGDVAGVNDLFHSFPNLKRLSTTTSSDEYQATVRILENLRAQLVDYFDIPADGDLHPSW